MSGKLSGNSNSGSSAPWEFLIQKEGDRTWLPLETPEVEILAGRYRLAARADRVNALMDIHITHLDTDPDTQLPRRRIQQRSTSTNDQGFLVVFPYSNLQSGTWEFTFFSGDTALSNQAICRLCLQVLPVSLETDVGDWPVAANVEPCAPMIPTISAPQAAAIAWSFQLELADTALVNPWGEPLTLVGAIQAQPESNTAGKPCWQGRLRVSLREPQSLTVIHEVWQPVQGEPGQTAFAVVVEVPDCTASRLVLGEIGLYPPADQNGTTPEMLALQEFTVMASLSDLLGALAVQLPQTLEIEKLPGATSAKTAPVQESTSAETETVSLNLSFFNIARAANSATAARPSHSVQQLAAHRSPLPPLLHSTVTVSDVARPLDLPTFKPTIAHRVAAPEPNAIADTMATAAAENVPPPAELLSDPWHDDELPAMPDLNLDLEALQQVHPIAATHGKSQPDVAAAFQSLKLNDRFWNRLNALMRDADLLAWLKSVPLEDELSDPLGTVPPQAEADQDLTHCVVPEVVDDLGIEPLTSTVDAWLSREIVLEDETLWPPAVTENGLNLNLNLDNLAHLTWEDPLPVPQMDLGSSGELVSGKTLHIRLRLPETNRPLYVKLWIIDLQTRMVMDGPHWIKEFHDNGRGETEAFVPLMVPFGSLEIQVAAIAVDADTQRESHKVTCDRAVVPPDLPVCSLAEFEM